FHELEFLVIPLVVYVATLRPQMRLRDTVLVWSGIASIVLFSKNTGYLTALVVVAYLWWMHWRVTTHRAIAVRRTLQWLLGAALLAGAVGAYTYLRSTQSAAIPSGNTEFRVHMYGLAWQRFLDSPLWGQAYAASAVQRFTLYEIRRPGNILPTHSDLLDILSHGGLLGIGLWLAAHVKLLGNTWRQVLARRGELAPHVVAMAHTFTCMVLAGVVTYAFNPLLLDPTRALVVWGQFGLLAGLTCSLAAARHAGLARDPAEP
ncbi:MAG: hypothetical protein OEW22_07655, partial [Rubrivivax sp.]|nr:hypothetical protein [Rubrivivax sp.]